MSTLVQLEVYRLRWCCWRHHCGAILTTQWLVAGRTHLPTARMGDPLVVAFCKLDEIMELQYFDERPIHFVLETQQMLLTFVDGVLRSRRCSSCSARVDRSQRHPLMEELACGHLTFFGGRRVGETERAAFHM